MIIIRHGDKRKLWPRNWFWFTLIQMFNDIALTEPYPHRTHQNPALPNIINTNQLNPVRQPLVKLNQHTSLNVLIYVVYLTQEYAQNCSFAPRRLPSSSAIDKGQSARIISHPPVAVLGKRAELRDSTFLISLTDSAFLFRLCCFKSLTRRNIDHRGARG